MQIDKDLPSFFTPMSLNEFQASIDSFSILKAFLWCFYPMAALVTLELLARTFDDDDDDQDRGKLIPVMQGAQ